MTEALRQRCTPHASTELEVLPPPVLTTTGNDTTRRWGIQRSSVLRFTETLPLEQKAALRWLDEYGRRHNLTRAELAAKLVKRDGRGGYSAASIYNNLTGCTVGGLSNFIEAIAAFKKSVEASMVPASTFPFVPTGLSKSIFEYAMLVWQRRRIGLMLGDSQAGKTRNLKEFARQQPHGQCHYIQVPTDGNLSHLIAAMCHERCISLKYNSTQQRLKLADSIDSSMLLIFDEIEECASRVKSGGRSSVVRSNTIDFIRWLRDTRGCAILLVGAPEAMDMLNDRNYSAFVRTLRRGMPPYWLKTLPTEHDLALFAKAAGLTPATGDARNLQSAIVKKQGLGFWIEVYLQGGKDIADSANEKLAWEHVHIADDQYVAAEKHAKVAQAEAVAARKEGRI